MTPNDSQLLPTEIHAKWIQAFVRWYHDANNDLIVELLTSGIAPSSANSRFLGAILSGQVRPLSGKQGGLYRFKQSVVDNTIDDMKRRGFKRKEILDGLVKRELVDSRRLTIEGLNQKIDRAKESPTARYTRLNAEFFEEYKRIATPDN